MSKLRSLNTCFWSDPFIEDLNPEAKLLFIYLITNEKTNMLGIYENSIRKMSFETGIKEENIKLYLDEFQELGKVRYIDNYVILINYMKHQNYNTNMKKSAIDIYNNLPNILKKKGLVVNKDNPIKGFESLLNHYGMVSKIEYEVEYEYEDEIEYKKKYSVSDFFKDWNTQRTKYTNKPSHLNRLTYEEKEMFAELCSDLENPKKEINDALIGFFRQATYVNGMDLSLNVKHFLKSYTTYYQAYHDKNPNVWGKNE